MGNEQLQRFLKIPKDILKLSYFENADIPIKTDRFLAFRVTTVTVQKPIFPKNRLKKDVIVNGMKYMI